MLLATSHQSELETVIYQSYMELANEAIPNASLRAQLEALVTSLKVAKTEIQSLKAQTEHQAILQSEIPPEVQTQQAATITAATNSIVGHITQGTQLEETSVHIWTKIQQDPIMRQIN